MCRPIGKVIGPPSLLHTTYSFANHVLHLYVALAAKLEVANKALAEERVDRQVVGQALWASQEMGSALTRDL
jgi:hypothetical protein